MFVYVVRDTVSRSLLYLECLKLKGDISICMSASFKIATFSGVMLGWIPGPWAYYKDALSLSYKESQTS